MGRLDDARDAAARAAAIRLAKFGDEHPAWWDTQQLLGQIEYEAGNLTRAAELVDVTLEFVERQEAGNEERRNTALDLYIAILERSGENPQLLTKLKSKRE
jgi:hypothetical protein